MKWFSIEFLVFFQLISLFTFYFYVLFVPMKRPTTHFRNTTIHSKTDRVFILRRMSDSESSELYDSEAGLEEEEDQLLSSENEENEEENEESEEENEESDIQEEQGDEPEELFYDDGMDDNEDENDDSSEISEEEVKLTNDELKRINLDDFSSDDEVYYYLMTSIVGSR